ncbi:hypothetical protein LC613_18855 [Nostoc sphaeroides CHAB 2801]|uniref:hypothetical protein n=1 Tax=Nostoc sphaeroides TaxID=446679 RepID=UPI001E396039|nr:hypothetical protein [Nostoc sphaeroides]MCC5629987.1 hypothetical protein [Nostoc sphaeroides CHAB 2801]
MRAVGWQRYRSFELWSHSAVLWLSASMLFEFRGDQSVKVSSASFAPYFGLPRLTSAYLGTSRSAQVARHKSLGTSRSVQVPNSLLNSTAP